jgi:hypothetical protein
MVVVPPEICYAVVLSPMFPMSGLALLMRNCDDFDKFCVYSIYERKWKPGEYISPCSIGQSGPTIRILRNRLDRMICLGPK